VGTIISAAMIGFAVGGLARWAVPGPDPMPVWLTIAIGLVGMATGGAIGAALFGRDNLFWILLLGIAASGLLVVAYRRFVQHRPVTGPEAHRLPTRGVGIARLRARLRRLGVDPDAIGDPRAAERAERLRRLRELRDAGLLTEEEYEERVRRLDRRA
jgi:uncharacterized membrane protein YeaQ/YmgE (transglycosylase-associated protein family)